MSAHFHVIIAASALRSSSETDLVVAHAALERPEEVGVLDAVALEEPNARRCPSAPGSGR